MKRQTIKDKQIKIFGIRETTTGAVKVYIHPINTTLSAHVRQLSAFERVTNQDIQDGSDIQFTINQRNLQEANYIEWRGNVYIIDGVDNYEFQDGRDIIVRAHLSRNLISFTSIEYKGWDNA